MKAHSFTSRLWPDIAVWNRDIDSWAHEALLDDLAQHAGCRGDVVRAMQLSSLAGRLFDEFHPNTFTPLILPLGIYHRMRLQPGVQFCADCLSERTPYYRRRWRLAICAVCVRHLRVLADRCERCAAPVNFHRADFDKRDIHAAFILTSCSVCGFDLRLSRELATDLIAVRNVGQCQERFFQALRHGFALLGDTWVHAVPYFSIIRHLMQLLASGRCSSALREATFGEPSEFSWSSRIHAIEHLGTSARFRLLVGVQKMLARWPESFIELASNAGLTRSDVLRGAASVPFALQGVIDQYFNYKRYSPSIAEIRAAIAVLRRAGVDVTPRSLSKILGSHDVLRKRHLYHLLTES